MADGTEVNSFRICFTFNNAEFMRDFNYTVNVLVRAYLNDTLRQGHPCGCAVGNLIAACNGHKVVNNLFSPISWEYSVVGSGFDWYEVLYPGKIWAVRGDIGSGLYQINSTGYSIDEVRRIENAFESTGCGKYTDDSIFTGLMAVVDVLAEIHGIDLKVKESAKLLFVK